MYFVAFDDNLDINDWFDPTVLDRLLPGALRFTFAADEQRMQDIEVK